MKSINILLASLAMVGIMSSCEDELNVKNPNSQTTADFGKSAADLKEAVIACYNHIRMEGTYARVGYTIDVCRGDEVWNSSQVWYLPYDNLNESAAVSDAVGSWPWRDWYYTLNVANYIITKVEDASLSESDYKEIKGQALFLRALGYYNLTCYYQNVPLLTNYSDYSSLDGVYATNASQDEVFDLIESDLKEAMEILPARSKGGEWAGGRATCGSAAGYYARALMFRHKYSEALSVLKDIINGKYGSYKLMADFGDNCREGLAYENNDESLFEIQYLDYGMQGTDDEWTPVNTSSNATQGHAIESNYGPGVYGGWADLSATPWLYNLYKAEKCTDGTIDPRLYWTLATYEAEYDGYTNTKTAAYPNGNDPRCNIAWQNIIPVEGIVTNANNGGIVIAKNTNARNNLYSTVITGLHCGVNLRMMRYSDVLLRAAECINEIEGPTSEAFGYINQVRNRAGLANLDESKFNTADKLFEQIANVERPKEFGCEFGRGADLIRWGFFYNAERLKQLIVHDAYLKSSTFTSEPVSYEQATTQQSNGFDSSYNYYSAGKEYLNIYQEMLNANPNLSPNSATNGSSNAETFLSKYSVHPIAE